MFKDAYEIAKKYTFPLVVTLRFFDKTIEGGLGSFIILNDDGWLMTAAHNLGASFAFNQHQNEIKEYQEKIQKINNKQIKEGQKKALIRAIKPNKKWVTDFSILLSGKSIQIEEYYIYGKHDLAFFRVDKSAINDQKVFPKIINPKNIKSGTSLCKLGFPFVEFSPTFNDATGQFELPQNLLPLPLFPIEGLYTRNLLTNEVEGEINVQYLETSSPGLKGQSGGPIFDKHGNIYAVQSKNVTLPLGFTGSVKVKGKTIEENQFLNVGIGVHAETIKFFLDKHNIKYELTD
ncbi:trypsin-like peptidase domain-containing protein [Labilibaculum euxinus]